MRLGSFPKRIVSLVPSQTELLYDLGLGDRVVGITKFCIKPNDWFRSKTRVGGTKNVNFERVADLSPDLIIANKEENSKDDILKLRELYPVWTSDVKTLETSIDMIEKVGEITDTESQANVIINNISRGYQNIKKHSATCLYFIWKDPMMVAGDDTFINENLKCMGFQNIAESLGRYPDITEKVSELKPDFVFLSSEPFPFSEKHVAEFSEKFPAATIKLIDGEMCSWFGSRLQLAPAYFNTFIEDLVP